MLTINNLVKSYGSFKAVDNLSLTVPKGEIFGFVGPNGAGKTTTMKIICGLLKADSGDVFINGIDAKKDIQGAKAMIGYMPDFFGVYDDLRVDEYLDFFADIYHIPTGDRKKLVEDLLKLVDLSSKQEAYVDGLSRGMKQRLCLARCLVHDPEILILDEPASGMDPRARFEMKEILRTLQNMGKTIIISSHILSELAELCTSIGIITKGQVVRSGTVENIMLQVQGKGQLKIRTKDNGEALRYLKELSSVEGIEEQGNELSVYFQGNDDDKAEVLKHLIQRGVSVYSFSQAAGSLEDVFMEVTNNEG